MRIDYLIFGYKKITVSDGDRAKAMNCLLKRGLTCNLSSEGEILVSSLKIKRYLSVLQGVEYEVSGLKGIPSLFLTYRRRYGVIVGFLIAFVYILVSSRCVWDIRAEGNEMISSERIEDELESVGFSVGTLWHRVSLSEIERLVLEKSDDIGWININRRGTVAYVTVREKNVYQSEKSEGEYSNIVASRDCVIEEITVNQGIPCVKAGDTVKAGELLISGVIPEALGGGFVKAEGKIFGVVLEEISVTAPKEERTVEYSEGEISEFSIKIFNFSLKLFKKYRKTNNACVIIEDEKECVLFGRYRIPFGIRKVYVAEKSVKNESYTEKQMVSIAMSRQNSAIRLRLLGCDVLKLQTNGGFTDGGYTVTTYATVLRSIGEERKISSSKNE